ncbi:MAG TPA: GNAT family N-acetyltransferase [Casimicrobiaceae bacterium]
MARAAKIAVRRAEVRDAEAIVATFATPRAMAGTLQLPYPSVSAWAKWIENTRADDYILVAEVETSVIGHVGLHAVSKSPRRRHAAGIGMSVHDDWQRRGVGSTLLRAAIDLADNWIGYTRLELTVYTDNAAALALYRKFGFVIEGTLRDYALRGGDYVDAYTMARFAPARPRRPRGATTTKDGESQ